MSHICWICTTCASVWRDGKRVGESGGERLFQKLQAVQPDWDLGKEFVFQPVPCMSACDRACAIAFVAPGKHTYLFGDLCAKEEPFDDVVDAILRCAELFYRKPEGLMAWAERPERLKRGIVARIPPQSPSQPFNQI